MNDIEAGNLVCFTVTTALIIILLISILQKKERFHSSQVRNENLKIHGA
jgi:hypothetical protein